MTQKYTLSDLLAYRDGDPLPSAMRAALDADPDLAAQWRRAIDLRGELIALPAETPPPELWEQIQAAAGPLLQERFATQGSANENATPGSPLSLAASDPAPAKMMSAASRASKSRWFATPQLRMATAASVFFIGLIASALWLRNLPESTPDLANHQIALQTSVQASSGLATLVDRSQRLEEAVQSQVVSAGAEPSRAQRALMFRIADLDAELNSLQQEAMHPELKERLWRQRVALLETLMEIQRFQMLDQADF